MATKTKKGTLRGPQISAVYGPPGTGKSTYLAKLVTELAITEPNMAVISFTKAAAGVLTGKIRNHSIRFIGTLHALAFRSLGLVKNQVTDEEKFSAWYGTDIEEMNIAMAVYNYSYHKSCDLTTAYSAINPMLPFMRLEHLITSFVNWKSAYQYISFNEMIEMATGNIEPFNIIVVDEAQDFTDRQWDMVLSMIAPDGKLIIGGDDDQALYTWCGANPHAMAQLAKEQIVLNQSWRIPSSVHTLAERLVNRIGSRTPKTYTPRAEEGSVSVASYYEPMMYGNHTILCRDKWVMKEVEEQIVERCIPYTCNSHPSIFDKARAKLIRSIKLEDYKGINRYTRYLYPKYRDNIPLVLKDGWEAAVDLGNYYEESRYLTLVDHLAEPVVTISTIHGFKGEEDDNIVLMAQCSGQVELSMDDNESYDNEMRVWYVGVTRPRHNLTIVGWNQYIGG